MSKDLLRMVVKKRTEDQKGLTKDADSMSRFSSRVAKLKGEGPMATSEEPEVALEVVSININDIEIPNNYMRKSVGDISDLVASIKVYGIQQPLKVVKIKGAKKFRLVFGKRRMAAAKQAGLGCVPCIVELVTREDRLMMLSLAENLNRNNITPMEESDCYHYLLQEAKSNPEEMCQSLGQTPEHIKRSMGFQELPDTMRRDINNSPINFTWDMMCILADAFRESKNNAKRLFQAIVSGEVKTPLQAENFIRNAKL